MAALRKAWLRISGFVVCLIAALLPYRPRLFLAKVLNYLSNPLKATMPLLLQRPLKFWNKVILGLVFFLGFPITKLFFLISGRTRLAPSHRTATFWEKRRPAEQLEQEIEEPF